MGVRSITTYLSFPVPWAWESDPYYPVFWISVKRVGKMNMEHLRWLLLGYSMGFGVSCCDFRNYHYLCNGSYCSNKKKESSGRFDSNHSDERKRKLLAINAKVSTSSCDASVWGVNENQSKEKKHESRVFIQYVYMLSAGPLFCPPQNPWCSWLPFPLWNKCSTPTWWIRYSFLHHFGSYLHTCVPLNVF